MDFLSSKIQKQRPQFSNPLLTILLSIVAVCALSIGVIFFSVCRKVVDLYLKLRIGKCYGGLVAPEDMIFLVPDVSKCCVTSVVYIRCGKETNMLKRFRQVIQKKIFDNPDNYPKLTSTVHQFGGYYYTKKYQCNITDAVKLIEVEKGKAFNDEYLKKYTGDVTNTEFAKDDTMLWDIHVAPCPIKGNAHKKPYTYPIITRFHHSIGDGTSLISLLIHTWGDKSCENYNKNVYKKIRNPLKNKNNYSSWFEWIIVSAVNFIKLLILYLEMIFMSFGRVIELSLFKPNNKNALHATRLSGKKICAWAVEEKEECIPLAKDIKNREGTSFNCVIATAMAASLSQYFKRNGFPIPEYMSGLITILANYPDEDVSTRISLKNRSGALIFDLPMIYGSTTLPQALQNISKEWKKQLKISDGLIITLLMRHIACIPLQIIKRCFGWKSQTFVLSNVPGGSAIQTRDGWVCEKIIPIAPNAQGIGVSFAILSYDEKFHIGILVDKTLVESQEEVQKMANDVLFYIKLLDRQTQIAI